MSIIPKKYDLPDHYSGSTLDDFLVRFNFDITNHTVRCYIRQDSNIPPIHKWEGNNVVKVDANNIRMIGPKKFIAKPGIYQYDLELTDPDDNSQTWLKGTIKIINDIT